MAETVKFQKRKRTEIGCNIAIGDRISVPRTYFDSTTGAEKYSELLPSTISSLLGTVLNIFPGRRLRVEWDIDGTTETIKFTESISVVETVDNHVLKLTERYSFINQKVLMPYQNVCNNGHEKKHCAAWLGHERLVCLVGGPLIFIAFATRKQELPKYKRA